MVADTNVGRCGYGWIDIARFGFRTLKGKKRKTKTGQRRRKKRVKKRERKKKRVEQTHREKKGVQRKGINNV